MQLEYVNLNKSYLVVSFSSEELERMQEFYLEEILMDNGMITEYEWSDNIFSITCEDCWSVSSVLKYLESLVWC